MENQNQKELLNQLDALASAAAKQQASIAGQEAETAFRILLQHKVEVEMKRQAEETYNKLLAETKQVINQFAQNAGERVLDLESQTIQTAPVFDALAPEFDDFQKALEASRQKRNSMALLQSGGVEEDILAAHSVGLSPSEIAETVLNDSSDKAIAQVKKIITESND